MILQIIFWFSLSLLFALMEVELEGKYGWSEKSQTWYRVKGHYPKIISFLLGGKPLNGYHIFMFPIVLLISHAHFFMGVEWTLVNELIALAIYFAWAPLWDYLWFVLNPHYGIKNFDKNKVWWFSKSHWIFNIVALEQISQWVLSIVLVVFASFHEKNFGILLSHLILLGGFFTLTIFTIFVIAPIYKNWYKKMRKFDDRSKANIFH